VVVLALYSWLIFRIVEPSITSGAWGNLILLPSEGVVVFLILIRRTTENVSRRSIDWILAFSATTAVLLVRPVEGRAFLPPAIGATVMLAGMFVQIHAKFVLGRSMGLVAAQRELKFAGPYRYVRHPMYLGYLITHCGFLMMNPSLWNMGVYVVCYALQIPRLMVEERLLSKDPRYAEYMTAVHYRLIPGVF
jgi:protein-S-isoprenylcysteine O-methyltransferase Ste14